MMGMTVEYSAMKRCGAWIRRGGSLCACASQTSRRAHANLL